MAFLDFIKNRDVQQKQTASSPERNTETAREMYARRAAEQEKASVSPEQLPPEQQAEVAEISATLGRAMRSEVHEKSSAVPEQSGDGTTSQPMAQKAFNQDKTAPMLSPTTESVGTRATEMKTHESSNEVKSPSQERSVQSTQLTVARRPPSWER